MARTRSRGKLFNLFRNNFKITFFHKPSMLEDDTFYYIVLDDILRLKIKMVYGTIIVDDVIPLTTAYLAKTYDTLVDTFINQSEFTILISLTGNISSLESSCIKAGAPIIEDQRFITIPKKLYSELRDYYKEDKSKYGFYLLAVREQTENDNHIDQYNKPVEAGNIPIIDQVMEGLNDLNNGQDIEREFVVYEYDSWEKGKVLNVSGIAFKLIYKEEMKELNICDINLDNMESFHSFLKICDLLEKYSKKLTIVLHNNMGSMIVQNSCEGRYYRRIDNDNTATLLHNQKYISNSFGSYKIEKMN